MGIAEIVGRAATFAFSAAVAHLAGLNVLGYLSLALTLVAYATIAGDSGLNQDSTRCLLAGDDPRIVTREALRIQLTATFIALTCVGLGVILIYGREVFLYFLAVSLVPIFSACSTPYLLDYRRRIAVLAASRLLQTFVISACGLFLILVVNSRGPLLGLAYGLGSVASALFLGWAGDASYKSALTRIEKRRLQRRLAVMRRLGLSSLLLHFFASAPLVVSGMLGTVELGEMGVVTRVWFLASAPAAMAGAVLLPMMSTSEGRSRWRVVVLIGVGLGAVGVVTVVLASGWLLPLLFGPEASNSTSALVVFITALPLYGIIAPSSSLLISAHMESVVAGSYAVGLVAFFAALGICVLVGNTVGATTIGISLSWVTGCSAVAVWQLGYVAQRLDILGLRGVRQES